jgi:hypothetical protein
MRLFKENSKIILDKTGFVKDTINNSKKYFLDKNQRIL